MKLLKYFAGSLIISFGILMVIVFIAVSFGVDAPQEILRYLLLTWVLLAICIMPFAKKIIRVE
ncbi:MAG: hypothetical protein DHS20C11_06500 [Lysobacteraceae bacterium]|nr:MAG: hypothetical protein DHS20C11_06500 [Xanthomonadaceae bacterium]